MISFPWSVAEKISVVVLSEASMDGQKTDFETQINSQLCR